MVRREKSAFSDCLQCVRRNFATCYKCERIKNKGVFKECDVCLGVGTLMYDSNDKLIGKSNFL